MVSWKFTVALVGSVLIAHSSAQAQQVIAFQNATVETAGEKGTIQGATVLIRDGRIVEVGTDVQVPVTAQVVDLSGKTLLPGFVDPYYVVSVAGATSTAEFREVTFGGRTFRIPTGTTSVPTSFTRILDGFDPTSEDWWDASRSGITSANLVARGFGESAIASVLPESPEAGISTKDRGRLFLALTNQSGSLDVLRKGLTDPNSNPSRSGGSSRGSASMRDRAAAMAAARARMGGRPSGSSGSTSAPSPEDELWNAVRSGKSPLFVNVNNAASILYLVEALKKSDKAKVALVAGGDDLIRTLDAIDKSRYTVVMPPRIDLLPNSQNRVNVARLLNEMKVPLAFSLSLNQNDYRQTQESPLFPVAMLVRSGLDRQIAIRALTKVPAQLMNLDEEIGSIEKDRRANFVIMDDDPFAATASIVQVVVDGRTIYEY